MKLYSYFSGSKSERVHDALKITGDYKVLPDLKHAVLCAEACEAGRTATYFPGELYYCKIMALLEENMHWYAFHFVVFIVRGLGNA